MEQLQAEGLFLSRSFWVIIGFLVVAPLSCCQSLDALKYSSSMSVIFILFLAIMVVLFTFPSQTGFDPCMDRDDNSMSGVCRGEIEYYQMNSNSLRALSVFVFGYTCQQVSRRLRFLSFCSNLIPIFLIFFNSYLSVLLLFLHFICPFSPPSGSFYSTLSIIFPSFSFFSCRIYFQ